MNYPTKKTVKSSVVPGVSFTVKILGEAPRARVEMEVAGARSKQRDLTYEYMGLQEKLDAILPPEPVDEQALKTDPKAYAIELGKRDEERVKALEPAQRRELLHHRASQNALNEQHYAIFASGIRPAWLKAGVISIAGCDVDGKPRTVDQLIEYGPDALALEIFNEIHEEARLPEAEAKNSQSPSSSDAVEDGTTKTTTAPSASQKAGTTPAAA